MARIRDQISRLIERLRPPKPLPPFNEKDEIERTGKRMIILGNAPMTMDMSEYIDASDLIVRFNECRNYGKGTGSRVDVLCINNFGQPAEEWAKDQTYKKLPFIGQVREIWLPRTPSLLEHRKTVKDRHFNPARFRDLGDALVSGNQLEDRSIVKFSDALNERILNDLKSLSSGEFREPSTGILAIAHILAQPRFADYRKIILGFTFEGWTGHPWSGEKALVERYLASNPSLAWIR